MTVLVVGLIAALIIGTIWCWATSPTYRQQRQQWANRHRQNTADRRYARTHRISA